jgi:hypothetical protein
LDIRALPAAPDIESEKMLANANVVSRGKCVLGPKSDERTVGRTQVANGEVVGVWVASDCCVSAAHERIIGEDNVSDFAPENSFRARKVVSIAGYTLDGLCGESGVTRRRRRPEDTNSMAALGR